MITPLQLALIRIDGTKRNIIIEPILEKQENGLGNTGVFKIYKDAFGDESTLFTEPLEIDDAGNELPDADNPDYLGKIIIDEQANWSYKGDLLSLDEQKQAATYILKY